MSYTILILRRARKELADLPVQESARITDAINALADEPRPQGCLKLSGRDGWRIRIGDYRVIYEIEDVVLTITVLSVGHRRKIYR